MKIMIIRHADPDYENDTITEKGWREAKLLTRRLESETMDAVYISPLGRAQATASLSLKERNMEGITVDWLREFHAPIERPDVTDKRMIPWDWLPEDWTREPAYYQHDQWMNTKIMQEGKVGEEYERVTREFDKVLAEHGYVRQGNYYRVEQENRKTLCFFCHFGVEAVLLSHLMNVSPMILWHHSCASPSTVTTLFSEERREGTATFRMNSFGDQSHLYMGGEPASFQARFCETYHSLERHN